MPSARQLAALAARAVRESGALRPRVLIDGPSGAGKSTVATLLAAHWPGVTAPELVRMDDLYPGWNGLEAASGAVVRDLLRPLADGMPGRWQRHDWIRSTPAEWHTVPAGSALIVEGCGALSRASAPLADVRLWLEADEAIRKHRTLARDDGAFDAHWEMWQRQFEQFERRERPRLLADALLDATPARSAGAGLP